MKAKIKGVRIVNLGLINIEPKFISINEIKTNIDQFDKVDISIAKACILLRDVVSMGSIICEPLFEI